MKKIIGVICILLAVSLFIASCDDFLSPVIEIFIQEENLNQNNKNHKIEVKEKKQQHINVQNGKK
jgi:hypothetical protein